ncbi:hypothetical protein EAO12_29025 [Klebsiella pneumoniae]|nr:hypothetical protein EAO12_29025 [Klebsiella pneumoniae]
MDITFTRLRAVRREGVNEHGPVQMSGVSGKFFRPNEAAAEWPEKLRNPAVPGQQDGLCLSQPRRMDSNR